MTLGSGDGSAAANSIIGRVVRVDYSGLLFHSCLEVQSRVLAREADVETESFPAVGLTQITLVLTS
jgi:hypothetical protein